MEPEEQWILSDQPVHDALVDKSVFEQTQLRLASRGPRSPGRITTRRKHEYALKGLLFHGTYGRRMQGNWIHNTTHYRCHFPSEYAIANKIDHPLTVYLREDAILDQLDDWLANVFNSERVEQSLAILEAAAQPDVEPESEELQRACRV